VDDSLAKEPTNTARISSDLSRVVNISIQNACMMGPNLQTYCEHSNSVHEDPHVQPLAADPCELRIDKGLAMPSSDDLLRKRPSVYAHLRCDVTVHLFQMFPDPAPFSTAR